MHAIHDSLNILKEETGWGQVGGGAVGERQLFGLTGGLIGCMLVPVRWQAHSLRHRHGHVHSRNIPTVDLNSRSCHNCLRSILPQETVVIDGLRYCSPTTVLMFAVAVDRHETTRLVATTYCT